MNRMKKKPVLYSILLFIFPFFLMAQDDLASLEHRIQELNKETRYTSLDSSLNRQLSLTNYLSRAYLQINKEAVQQFKLLIGLEAGKVPEPGPLDGGSQKLLERFITSKGKVILLQSQVNQLARLAKLEGENLNHSVQVLSDRQLRVYHHQIQKVFAENQGFKNPPHSPLREVFTELITETELELQKRGFFPLGKEQIPNLNELLTQRFSLVERLNRTARMEAIQFADRSPLLLESRSKGFLIISQIQDIDQKLGIAKDKLPHFRDLFTDETVEARISSMELAKRQSEMEYHTKRHYGAVAKIHSERLEDAIVAEKKWKFIDVTYKTIRKGLSTRGPPGPPHTTNFNSSPIPPKPANPSGPASLSLDEFMDKAKLNRINRKSQLAYDKFISKEIQRFEAYGFSKSNFPTAQQLTRPISISPKGSPIATYLKNQALEYYNTIAYDPVKGALINAELEQAIVKIHKTGQAINKVTLLGNDLPAIKQVLDDLHIAKKAMLKKSAVATPLERTYYGKEIQLVNNAITELSEAKVRARNNLAKLITDPIRRGNSLFQRPPPEVESWIRNNNGSLHELYNEAFYMEVLDRQQKALERQAAIYGQDLPAGAKQRLANIKHVKVLNETTRVLATYREFSSQAHLLKTIETSQNWNTQAVDIQKILNDPQKMAVLDDIKANQMGLRTKLADLDLTFQKSKVGSTLPKHFHQDIKQARKTMPKSMTSKKIRVDIQNWRPNQDFKKLGEMTSAKTPGGIWLTPNGRIQIKKLKIPEHNWLIISSQEKCPTEMSHTKWPLTANQETSDQICYPLSDAANGNKLPWINSIETWF